MKTPSVRFDCDIFPEMVDDAMGQFASSEGDLRAAVTKAGCQTPTKLPILVWRSEFPSDSLE